jgi:hypothetical protein
VAARVDEELTGDNPEWLRVTRALDSAHPTKMLTIRHITSSARSRSVYYRIEQVSPVLRSYYLLIFPMCRPVVAVHAAVRKPPKVAHTFERLFISATFLIVDLGVGDNPFVRNPDCHFDPITHIVPLKS